MTTTSTLIASKRDGTGKGVARKLRQSGRVPAVLYGKDMESIAISLDAAEVEHLFRSISTDNTIVEVKIEGEKKAHQTLVREIQAHPHKPEVWHVDFLRIQAGVAVEVDVPVHLVGVPVGVRADGGVIEHLMHELPVRCIPSLIPESFELDISEMEIESAMHVSDLRLPEGVEVTVEADRTVCMVVAPRGGPEEEGLAEGEEAIGEVGLVGEDEDESDDGSSTEE